MKRVLLIIGALAFIVVGCSKSAEATDESKKVANPSGKVSQEGRSKKDFGAKATTSQESGDGTAGN